MDSNILYSFAHSILKQVCLKRYACNAETVKAAHMKICELFKDKESERGSMGYTHRAKNSDGTPNIQRLLEVPAHLVRKSFSAMFSHVMLIYL